VKEDSAAQEAGPVRGLYVGKSAGRGRQAYQGGRGGRGRQHEDADIHAEEVQSQRWLGEESTTAAKPWTREEISEAPQRWARRERTNVRDTWRDEQEAEDHSIQEKGTGASQDAWDGRGAIASDQQRWGGQETTLSRDTWAERGTHPSDWQRRAGRETSASQDPWSESDPWAARSADLRDQQRQAGRDTAAAQDPWAMRGADPWQQGAQERQAARPAPAGREAGAARKPWAERAADPGADPWEDPGGDPWARRISTIGQRPRATQVQSSAHSDEWNWYSGGSSSSDQFRARDTAKSPQKILPQVTLHVDRSAGAGLSLIWCSGEGYLVSDIDPWPGQPGLRVGDMIRAISGVRLDSASSEPEVERRFGSAFCDGAQLEVLRKGDTFDKQNASPAVSNEFKTHVRVQPGKGAGLALVWHSPEGYLIEDIDPTPGQLGLCPGDVVRAVAGVSLRGYSTETAADRALAGALADGALLQVFRPQVHARGGDVVAIPTGVGASSPLQVSSLALGTWSWGNDKWGHDTWGLDCRGGAEARRELLAGAFHTALEHGAFFVDTAPTYGHGFAEDMLGRVGQGGGYAVIATKYYPREADRDLAAAMVTSAQKSMDKLRLDRPLDLFQLHRPAEPPTSLEAQADALAAVVQAGLARAVGVCSFLLDEIRIVHERLRRVHNIPLSTVQVELSLAHQLPVASGLVAACHEMGVAVLAYSPLGMGRLSGKYDPMRDPPLRFGRDGRQVRPFGTALDADPAAHASLLSALRVTGRRYGGRTIAQVALNWVLSQGAVAISGARTQQQAQDNAGAMGWRLSDEDVTALTALGARGAQRGDGEAGTSRGTGRGAVRGAFVPEGRGRRH